jgi:hypothetical protein
MRSKALLRAAIFGVLALGPGATSASQIDKAHPPVSAASFKPALYGIVVGVTGDQGIALKADYGSRTARAFASMLGTQEDRYAGLHLWVLLNENATAAAIARALAAISEQATSRDLVLIFLSGLDGFEGVDTRGGCRSCDVSYFITADTDRHRLSTTGLRSFGLLDGLDAPGFVVVVINTPNAAKVRVWGRLDMQISSVETRWEDWPHREAFLRQLEGRRIGLIEAAMTGRDTGPEFRAEVMKMFNSVPEALQKANNGRKITDP